MRGSSGWDIYDFLHIELIHISHYVNMWLDDLWIEENGTGTKIVRRLSGFGNVGKYGTWRRVGTSPSSISTNRSINASSTFGEHPHFLSGPKKFRNLSFVFL
jgi:hypothetical protein